MYKDMHIHLENCGYHKKALLQIVKQACSMAIDEIGIVEHTHRFNEFKPLYRDVLALGGPMSEFYLNKQTISISAYLGFIEEMKKEQWPIKINYGLEICYFPQFEEFLYEQMHNYPFDFYIGSVHHIDNAAFDLKGISEAYLWSVISSDEIYNKYYRLVEALLRFGQFEVVGHIDTIKLFNYYPTYDLKPTYEKLAKLAKRQLMIVENNSGAHYRYHHKDIGINQEFLRELIKQQVKIHTASDAHYPRDVGKYVDELSELTDKDFT